MEKGRDILQKSVLLRFICEDEPIGYSFIQDIEVQYYAPEITYLFQNLALAAFTIITSAVGAYLVYKTKQQPDEMIDKERLISEIQLILKNNHEEIENGLKNIEKKIGHFDPNYKKIIEWELKQRKSSGKKEAAKRKKIKEEFTQRDKEQLSQYREKLKKLDNIEDAARLLVEILEEEYEKGYDSQKDHVNKFRSHHNKE